MKNMKSGRLMHWNPWKVRVPLKLNRPAFMSPLIIILIVAFPQSARCNKRFCVTESLPLHLCCHFISALQTFTFISSFNVKLIFLTWVCEWQMCDVIPHSWNQLLIIVFFSFALRFGLSCLINWSQNGSAVFLIHSTYRSFENLSSHTHSCTVMLFFLRLSFVCAVNNTQQVGEQILEWQGYVF